MVRHARWRPEHTGTITEIDPQEERSIFVDWHGTCVNDQVHPDDLILITDPEEILAARQHPARPLLMYGPDFPVPPPPIRTHHHCSTQR